MKPPTLDRIIAGVFLLVAVFFAYRAWQGLTNATVVVEWSTATELETAGFNLYRSETPDGPFERVNTTLIPSATDPLTGGDYAFEDNGLKGGKTYYYNLEEVELNGGANTHGPIEVEAARTWLWDSLVALVGLVGAAVVGFSQRKQERGDG